MNFFVVKVWFLNKTRVQCPFFSEMWNVFEHKSNIVFAFLLQVEKPFQNLFFRFSSKFFSLFNSKTSFFATQNSIKKIDFKSLQYIVAICTYKGNTSSVVKKIKYFTFDFVLNFCSVSFFSLQKRELWFCFLLSFAERLLCRAWNVITFSLWSHF